LRAPVLRICPHRRRRFALAAAPDPAHLPRMVGRILFSEDCMAEGPDWLARAEPRFAEALDLCGPPPLRRRADGFPALMGAIVSQQVSTAAARAIQGRLEAAGWPRPRRSARRGRGIARGGAVAAEDPLHPGAGRGGIDFDALRGVPDDEIVATLVALPGIGRWTAEIYAMFSLGRADVFAPNDLALQEAARLLFALPERPKERALRAMAAGLVALADGCGRDAVALLPPRQGARRGGVKGDHGAQAEVGPQGGAEGPGPVGGDPGAWLRRRRGRPAGAGRAVCAASAAHRLLRPNAPERCANNPYGYQWFPIPWLDGSSQAAAAAGMRAAEEDLNAFIDEVLEAEGLGPGAGAGGLQPGHDDEPAGRPAPAEPVAAVVGFSGRLLNAGTLAGEVKSRMPVLLIHGDMDEMVPVASLKEAADALTQAGFETYAHVSKGIGHGIAPDGLSLALGFLRDKLPG
jgi:hypothetical protein